MASSSRFLVLSTFLVALMGCKGKDRTQENSPTPIAVGRVSVSFVEVLPDGTALRHEDTEEAMARQLERRVEKDGRIRLGQKSADPLELAVVLSPLTGEPGTDGKTSGDEENEDEVGLLFTLRTTYGDGWKISSSIATRAGFRDSSRPDALTDEVIRDLLDGLIDQIQLFDSTDDELASLVKRGSDDPDSRAMAIRILGERRSTTASPVLAQVLDDTASDDPLMEDLIGALGRIGNESATPALVRAFGRAAPYQEVIIIQALGSTGGQEARQFLSVVASGHESDVVRNHASQVLHSMDKGVD